MKFRQCVPLVGPEFRILVGSLCKCQDAQKFGFVFFYTCFEILVSKLREELTQRLFEKTGLRKVFGTTRPEKMRHLYAPYYSGDIINERDRRAGGHVVGIGENKHEYRVLVWQQSGRK